MIRTSYWHRNSQKLLSIEATQKTFIAKGNVENSVGSSSEKFFCSTRLVNPIRTNGIQSGQPQN